MEGLLERSFPKIKKFSTKDLTIYEGRTKKLRICHSLKCSRGWLFLMMTKKQRIITQPVSREEPKSQQKQFKQNCTVWTGAKPPQRPAPAPSRPPRKCSVNCMPLCPSSPLSSSRIKGLLNKNIYIVKMAKYNAKGSITSIPVICLELAMVDMGKNLLSNDTQALWQIDMILFYFFTS